MSTLLAGIDTIDREYWLGHCEGFRVRAGNRRLGIVEFVRYGSDPRLPDTLHICAGFVWNREIALPIEDVETVEPRTETIWMRSRSAEPGRTSARVLGWLRRAGARSRWVAQRG